MHDPVTVVYIITPEQQIYMLSSQPQTAIGYCKQAALSNAQLHIPALLLKGCVGW